MVGVEAVTMRCWCDARIEDIEADFVQGGGRSGKSIAPPRRIDQDAGAASGRMMANANQWGVYCRAVARQQTDVPDNLLDRMAQKVLLGEFVPDGVHGGGVKIGPVQCGTSRGLDFRNQGLPIDRMFQPPLQGALRAAIQVLEQSRLP